MRVIKVIVVVAILSIAALAQAPQFEGAEQWRSALTAKDAASLKALYSVNPPARFITKEGKPGDSIAPETDFWEQEIKAGVKDPKIISVKEDDKNGLHLVNLQLSMKVPSAAGPKTRYVIEQQAWQQQGDQWRIVLATHTDLLKIKQPSNINSNLYEKDADAKTDIKNAVAKAAKEHNRVILVFGGNWCYDCHVLDAAFHEPDVQPIVDKNFEVVHVDIGEDGTKNADLVEQYQIPLDKGVPALAVLDSDGKLLYSQQNGEWQEARSMDPDDIIMFLNKWKP
ncbi:MAG: thioredoxin family protein [Terriglobales bacterium]